MKSFDEIIAVLQSRADCHFRPATSLPLVPSDLRLPPDVVSFYQRFGEGRLFTEDGDDPPCHLLPPDKFVQVGLAMLGEATTTGVERSWYALADVRDGNFLAIDLLPTQLGRVYDCFHETYGEPGYCNVIALSFTELLNRLADAEGQPYWLDEDFGGYGDAYGDGD
ncbi:MAG: SMI1/KNR4 family protein [Pirellulaceae bacterium]|nr:SMI1/KNR4 family protein [Pirellulaceae bacterium]